MATIRDAILTKSNTQAKNLATQSVEREQRNKEMKKNHQHHQGQKPSKYADKKNQSRNTDDQYSPQSFVPRLIQDGLDHINMWTRGVTPLGRTLSMDASNGFDTQYGNFRSIYALWVFLTTKDHPAVISEWTDRQLRDWSKVRESNGQQIDFPNVKYICVSEMIKYIMENEGVRDALIDSGDVPLVSYIEHETHGRFRHQHDAWWSATISLVRSQLRAEQDIDITMLLSDTSIERYPEIKPTVTPVLGVIKTPVKPKAVKQVKEAKPAPEPVSAEQARENARAATRAASESLRAQLRTELQATEHTFALTFTVKDNRTLFMMDLVQGRSVDSTITEAIKTGKAAIISDEPIQGMYTLYIWLDDGKVVSLSTDLFENPLDFEQERGNNNSFVVTVDESKESMLTVARRVIGIHASVPDEAIQIRHVPEFVPRKDKQDTLMIREDTYNSETLVQEPSGDGHVFTAEETQAIMEETN